MLQSKIYQFLVEDRPNFFRKGREELARDERSPQAQFAIGAIEDLGWKRVLRALEALFAFHP